ncbi:MAG: DMT family transporter [Eubacteriales bacterium]|nr:DMT family transporter [Eubacteriales bacterium]MDD4565913.1 DMT family transporter [Eubacteriales bacterium]
MRQKLKADLALVSVALLWGVSYPITSVVLNHVGPYSYLAIRYLLAAIILFPIAFKNLKNIDSNTLKGGIFIGLSLFLGCVLQTVGLLYTTPSKSGFLTGINVVFVAIFVAVSHKKIPDFKSNLAVILSIIGLAFISLDGSMRMNIGDVLTIFCAIAFAAQILLVDKYSRGADVILMSLIQVLVVGIFSLPPAIMLEGLAISINRVTVASIIFTAIFCTGIAYIVQNKMQPYTKPTHAAIIFLSEPVFSAIFSTFIGDRLTGKTLIGCIFIMLGMIVVNLKFKINRQQESSDE